MKGIAFFAIETREQQVGGTIAGVDLQCFVGRLHCVFFFAACQIGSAENFVAFSAVGVGLYRLFEVGGRAFEFVAIFQKDASHSQVGLCLIRVVFQRLLKCGFGTVGQLESEIEMADAGE